MALDKNINGAPFNETATGSTSAVATHTGSAGHIHFVTDIAASSDKAGAILLVKQGTTTIWQLQVGAASFQAHFESPLEGVDGSLVSVEIDGTSACKANIAGYTL